MSEASVDTKEFDIDEFEDDFRPPEHLPSAEQLDLLRQKHPDNPLFKDEFKDIPAAWVPVYHFTHEKDLDQIGKDGLTTTRGETIASMQAAETKALDILRDPAIKEWQAQKMQKRWDERKAVDDAFEQAAPEGFSRDTAQYAYPDQNYGGMGKGGVVLEIMVDPDKVLVADAEEVSGTATMPERAREFARNYWEGAMPLSEYRQVPVSEKPFIQPEVLIPSSVPVEQMRVAAYYPSISARQEG